MDGTDGDGAAADGRRTVVLVVGAGFGGLTLVRALRGEPVEITLVDRQNFHLFQPLLYQVATAGLEPSDIAYPVRGILWHHPHATFRTGEVTGLDLEGHRALLSDGSALAYDHVVLAPGSRTATFGVPGAQEHAFGLKGLDDATSLRSHLLRQFEHADAHPQHVQEGQLTVVVVGGGPTGVELAGSLVELYHKVLARDFPRLDLVRARIVLVEMADAVLAPFEEHLRDHAARQLRQRGVELVLGTSVAGIDEDGVELDGGQRIAARTVVWAAGVRANDLDGGLETGRGGRVTVEPDLSVPGHPEVWVVGDLAGATDAHGAPLPQLAPVAQQEARHVARQILRRRRGAPTTPFRYLDKGTMATIGRRAAVVQLPGGLRFTGTIAWWMWLVLHIVTLIGFRNRVSVLVNWAWNYFTWQRAARLVIAPLGEHPEDGVGT